MTASDILSLIANVALALSFIVALVFGIAQVRAAGRDRREPLRNFQSHEFAKLKFFLTTRDTPASIEELRMLPVKEQVATGFFFLLGAILFTLPKSSGTLA